MILCTPQRSWRPAAGVNVMDGSRALSVHFALSGYTISVVLAWVLTGFISHGGL